MATASHSVGIKKRYPLYYLLIIGKWFTINAALT